MKKTIMALLPLLILMVFEDTAQAQKTGIAALQQVFTSLQKAYKTSNNQSLSFGIRYSYTNENHTETLLDTAHAFFEMSGNNYHLVIDSTETIMNDSVQVILFKDDKLMYLSKTPEQASSLLQNPVALLDGGLLKMPGLSAQIETTGDTRKASLIFPAGMEYKKIDFWINTTSGYLTRAVYTVKTERMFDAGEATEEMLKKYDDYALVTADYKDYSTKAADKSAFDNTRFYQRQAGETVPAKAYNDYKVYVNTPGF